MSKITNDGLTRSVKGWQKWASKGQHSVNEWLQTGGLHLLVSADGL